MKVYVVASYEFEGINILKIFLDKKKAEQYANKMEEESHFVIRIYEHGVE